MRVDRPIFLVGMMGTGKTTVAEHLGQMLGMEVLDMDSHIESQEAKTISEIFNQEGELYFRDLEGALVRDLIDRNLVIASGGGAFVREENRQLMLEGATVVWLQASPAEIARRLARDESRPLLAGEGDLLSRIQLILDERIQYYSQAQIHINSDDKDIDELCLEIIAQLRSAEVTEVAEVAEVSGEMYGKGNERLAIFDFDGTLYPHETFTFLVNQFKVQADYRHLYNKFNRAFLLPYIAYKLKLMSKTRMRELALIKYIEMFRGLSEAEIQKFFDQAYPDMAGQFTPEVVAELERARAGGYKIVVVSGAVKPILDRAGTELDFDLVLGSVIPVRNGFFDKEAVLSYIHGQGKVRAVEEGLAGQHIDWQASIAYADSGSDLPILEAVGTAIAVNPDSELRTMAEAKGWRIMDIETPDSGLIKIESDKS